MESTYEETPDLSDEASLAILEKTDDGGPSGGLFSFYDRLRARIVGYVDQHGGRLGPRTADALLLVPDVFMLLVRLALDKQVPQSTRMLVGGALAYFVLPADIMPEVFVGPAGYLDDLILGLVVLAHAFDADLEPFAEKHWSGSKSFRAVLRDLLSTANVMLSNNVYARLRDYLAKRGIDLDDVTQRHTNEPSAGEDYDAENSSEDGASEDFAFAGDAGASSTEGEAETV